MYSGISIYGIDFKDFAFSQGIIDNSYNDFMGIFCGYDLGYVNSINLSITNDGSSRINDFLIGVPVSTTMQTDYNSFIQNELSSLISELKNNINNDPDAITEVNDIIPSIVTVSDYYSFMDKLENYIKNTSPEICEVVCHG